MADSMNDRISLPIRRDVVFEEQSGTRCGYVAIVRVEILEGSVKCYLVAELDGRWEGSVSGVDVLQALSIAARVLDIKMNCVNGRCAPDANDR